MQQNPVWTIRTFQRFHIIGRQLDFECRDRAFDVRHFGRADDWRGQR